jgi:hypothetical protein
MGSDQPEDLNLPGAGIHRHFDKMGAKAVKEDVLWSLAGASPHDGTGGLRENISEREGLVFSFDDNLSVLDLEVFLISLQ